MAAAMGCNHAPRRSTRWTKTAHLQRNDANHEKDQTSVFFPSHYRPILELLPHDSDSKSPSSPKYQLKSNVSLHMYTSSAPCGNATLKKFAKMTRERYDHTLDPNTWPTSQSHHHIHLVMACIPLLLLVSEVWAGV